MKRFFVSMIMLAVLASCGNKDKAADKKEAPKADSKTEVVKKETSNKEGITKEFETKSGKAFLVTEEKPSASISKITITPKGFSESNNPIELGETDPFDYALVADVNGDGFDEIYVITRGAGSGSYAKIYGVSSNRDKSATPIYVPELSDDDFVKLFPGYMGHDTFYVEGDKLMRKYPVYKKEDSQNNPTGGERVLEYVLKPGEASWILEIKK